MSCITYTDMVKRYVDSLSDLSVLCMVELKGKCCTLVATDVYNASQCIVTIPLQSNVTTSRSTLISSEFLKMFKDNITLFIDDQKCLHICGKSNVIVQPTTFKEVDISYKHDHLSFPSENSFKMIGADLGQQILNMCLGGGFIDINTSRTNDKWIFHMTSKDETMSITSTKELNKVGGGMVASQGRFVTKLLKTITNTLFTTKYIDVALQSGTLYIQCKSKSALLFFVIRSLTLL
jgi:hypothetical protein